MNESPNCRPENGVPVAAGARERKLADVGWCWDGQGFNGGVDPSIFGAGEGTRWFGLSRCCYMFHPNTDLALEKLRGFDEVVCEVSKWKVRRVENGVAHCLDGRIEVKRAEAAAVSELSLRFPNITGAIDDDLLGIIRREGIRPAEYAAVYDALKSANPALSLWTVVYETELERGNWAGFEPFTDVIHLCIGAVENFTHIDQYLDQCDELFPGKPVNLCYRLRDFRARPPGPVPLETLIEQWEMLSERVRNGRLCGYSILGGFLIDMHPETACWVRDFIASS